MCLALKFWTHIDQMFPQIWLDIENLICGTVSLLTMQSYEIDNYGIGLGMYMYILLLFGLLRARRALMLIKDVSLWTSKGFRDASGNFEKKLWNSFQIDLEENDSQNCNFPSGSQCNAVIVNAATANRKFGIIPVSALYKVYGDSALLALS